MYERMLERAHEPNSEEIRGYLGEESYGRLVGLKEMLEQKYHLVTALRFPFGKNYGWGYKFSDRYCLILAINRLPMWRGCWIPYSQRDRNFG